MRFILNEFDRISNDAAERHTYLTNALVSKSKEEMSDPFAFSPKRVRTVKNELVGIAQRGLETEHEQVGILMEMMSKNARETAFYHLGIPDTQNDSKTLRDALKASHEASTSYLSSEITSQVNRDVNQVIRTYRNASLRVLMNMDASGMSRAEASKVVLMEEIRTKNKLFFTDRRGRKISSDLHIRRTWRETLRDHWVKVYLHVLSSNGVSQAMLWHPDTQHEFYGVVLSLTEPDYGIENADRAFHPNSRALPVALEFMEAAA